MVALRLAIPAVALAMLVGCGGDDGPVDTESNGEDGTGGASESRSSSGGSAAGGSGGDELPRSTSGGGSVGVGGTGGASPGRCSRLQQNHNLEADMRSLLNFSSYRLEDIYKTCVEINQAAGHMEHELYPDEYTAAGLEAACGRTELVLDEVLLTATITVSGGICRQNDFGEELCTIGCADEADCALDCNASMRALQSCSDATATLENGDSLAFGLQVALNKVGDFDDVARLGETNLGGYDELIASVRTILDEPACALVSVLGANLDELVEARANLEATITQAAALVPD